MIKLFGPKIVNRVHIYELGDKKISQELHQAKGVMNNYLNDKHFTVNISHSNLEGEDYVDVEGVADSKRSLCCVSIKKEGEIPFLRKIYSAIEMFAKDPTINKK